MLLGVVIDGNSNAVILLIGPGSVTSVLSSLLCCTISNNLYHSFETMHCA